MKDKTVGKTILNLNEGRGQHGGVLCNKVVVVETFRDMVWDISSGVCGRPIAMNFQFGNSF